MRGKVIGVLTILLLAPVTAELLQAYLGDLGGIGGLVFVDLFFAPLYGGMALLIREVSVRTGRGWRGRLLLAAAFGVAMPTIIDLSLFTPVRDDIDDWGTIVSAVSLGGIGWYAAITWVAGHVLMSVTAPVVVGETLARHPGPWLGKLGLVITGLAFIGMAAVIHHDQATSYAIDAGPADYVVSSVIIATLVVLAFTPLGRPLDPGRARRTPPLAVCLAVGVVGMAVLDFVPLSLIGLAVFAVTLSLGLLLVARWSGSPGWTQRHLAALTLGALLTRTVTGFLAPLPQDTTWPEKITQNATYLALILLLGWAMHRRTRRMDTGAVDALASGKR
ncbi:hypothetical protein [Nocardioides alcanivorans]|uniref:hypothetical protein n=1 Tax=Nocardioides alcanivorans TaxID=2897352 RepID=UPI001F3DD887|nr:hypothetical protein [Nocardioides alcanivorans]